MRIDASGNVGIGTGTATLGSRLVVNGASGASPFRAQINGSTKLIVNSNGGVSVGSSSSSPSNGLFVSGSVGIGTTSPAKRLHVVSNGIQTDDNTADGDALIVNATGDGASWGVNASSNSDAVHARSVNSYGVYASSTNWDGLFARTGNPSVDYAGWFEGDINVTGTVFQGSDRKLKQNIADFTSAMHIINQLQPKLYEYRQDGSFKLMNLPRGKHYGLIAQDVEQVLPNLVKESKFDAVKMAFDGKKTEAKGEEIDYKALNYTELIPVIIKGMQELARQNQELLSKNEDLQKQINELKGVKTSATQPTDAAQSVITLLLTSTSLEQNSPNPFTGATTIRYSLPTSFKAARIIVTDYNNKLIKQVQLSTAGSGTINMDASTLSAGTYSYSLVVDGKVIESKKMIIAH